MRLRAFPEALEGASLLDPAADAVAGVVRGVVPLGQVKDALSGTWLGHALHPLLTDLPIGFWTSAWALDILGGRESQGAARKLVGLGVLSAVPAALTGASDWTETGAGARRVGLVHGLTNAAALACYGVSYVHRRRGRRGAGVAWGWAGAGAATVGGYLGGHLVSAMGVGVERRGRG